MSVTGLQLGLVLLSLYAEAISQSAYLYDQGESARSLLVCRRY